MMSSMEPKKTTVIVSLVAVWHGAVLSASAAGVIGVDGSPLSGAFDPTKCRIDRSDDQFKSNEIGGQCARCVTNDQCRHAYGGFGWYCCPFMKRCVNSGSMGCYDTAFCKPRCFGEKYPELKQECSGCDGSFPDNWVKGCTRSDWPALVQGRGGPAPAPQPQPRPVPQPVGRPPVGGGNNGGGAGGEPEWCEYCQPDIYETKRCEYWKEQLNWCVSGKPVTMREKCAETCGYCDGCSGPVVALPTPAPVAFNKVGPDCQPDNKQSCASWKKKGECEGKHKEWMKTVCADTCGYCTPAGQPSFNPAPAPRPAPEPRRESPTPRPVALPAPKPARNNNLSGCARHGENGAACQAAAGCEWSWDQFACVSSAPANDKCMAIGSDGQTCVATTGCKWDWNLNSCVMAEVQLDKCQHIGADGFTCNQTEGCRWDWDVNSCIFDASARVVPASSKKQKGGKKGRGGGCAGLNSKKCSKSSSCVLDGRVCRNKF